MTETHRSHEEGVAAAAEAMLEEMARQAFDAAPKKHEIVDRLINVIDGVKAENDRSTAIILFSFLDDVVKELFMVHLYGMNAESESKLFGLYGMMPSCSVRVRMLYHLGWIGESTRHDIAIFARVRNLFAHRYSVASFTHQDVSGLLASLKGPADAPLHAALGSEEYRHKRESILSAFGKKGKFFFIWCFHMLMVRVLEELSFAPVAMRFQISPQMLLKREREELGEKETFRWRIIASSLRVMDDIAQVG